MKKKTQANTQTIKSFQKTWGFPLTRVTKIDDQILKHFGFKKLEKKDVVDREIWELKVPFYPQTFRYMAGDYPANNPNCGILSIHEDAHEVEGYDRNGRKKIYKYNESTRAIAYYVNTAERLRGIIQILTETNT